MQELLEQEKIAKDAIINFITLDVNGRTTYKQVAKAGKAQRNKEEHDDILNIYAPFWKACISASEDYMSNIDKSRFTTTEIELDDDDDEMSKSRYPDDNKNDEYIYGSTDSEPKEDSEENSKKKPTIQWETPLEYLDSAYQAIKDEFLVGSGYVRECDELYKELKEKIRMAQKATWERKIKYKALHLELLEKSLNLQNPAICELLPYLITAYIFNSQQSHFFYHQEARDRANDDDKNIGRFWQLFSDCEIDAIDAGKIRAMTESVPKLFTLADCSDKYLIKAKSKSDESSGTTSNCNDDVRALLYEDRLLPQMKGSTYIRYRALLNDIFLTWCRILRQCSEKFNSSGLSIKINYQESIDLYNYYTGQNIPISY